jgi:hypothetical protein
MKKTAVFAFAALCLIIPAEAEKNKGGGNENAQEERRQKAAERAKKEKDREAVKELLAEKDKNDDGTLTKDEYIAGEADQAAASESSTSIIRTATARFPKLKSKFYSGSNL